MCCQSVSSSSSPVQHVTEFIEELAGGDADIEGAVMSCLKRILGAHRRAWTKANKASHSNPFPSMQAAASASASALTRLSLDPPPFP